MHVAACTAKAFPFYFPVVTYDPVRENKKGNAFVFGPKNVCVLTQRRVGPLPPLSHPPLQAGGMIIKQSGCLTARIRTRVLGTRKLWNERESESPFIESLNHNF